MYFVWNFLVEPFENFASSFTKSFLLMITALLFLTVAARALKSREESGFLCVFFSWKLYGYGRVCFQQEWKFQYQAVNPKSSGLLQPILYKLNTCPSIFNTACTMALPVNVQVCSLHRAFHRVYTCKGDCNWLGPRRLAEFHAGRGGVSKQTLLGLPDSCVSRSLCVSHSAGFQHGKYL